MKPSEPSGECPRCDDGDQPLYAAHRVGAMTLKVSASADAKCDFAVNTLANLTDIGKVDRGWVLTVGQKPVVEVATGT